MNEKTMKLATLGLAIAISASMTATSAAALAKGSEERAFARNLYSPEGSIEYFEAGEDAERVRPLEDWETFLSLDTIADKSVWSYERKTVKIAGVTL